jgi:hypothetical protein
MMRCNGSEGGSFAGSFRDAPQFLQGSARRCSIGVIRWEEKAITLGTPVNVIDSAAGYMKIMLRSALVAAILIARLAMSQHTEAPSSSALLGAWKLRSVGGSDPASINIKSWRIEFRAQEQWIYSAAMTGEYEGTKVSGSGTWLLEGSQLSYTVGDNRGKTIAHVDGDSLTLSPDPVIRLHGKEPIETQYVRLASP